MKQKNRCKENRTHLHDDDDVAFHTNKFQMILGSATSFAFYINFYNSKQNQKQKYIRIRILCNMRNQKPKTKKNNKIHISSIYHKCTYVIAPYTQTEHSERVNERPS